MIRIVAAAAAGALALGAAPALAGDRPVSIASGSATLHGTLTTPDAGPVFPAAVLLISGSGPTDRDGDSVVPGVKPGSQRLIAQGLAARGIASLRFDKRGVGESKAALTSEAALRFTDYLDDAAAWAKRLLAEPGVRCVVIAGHSEGSLIGILAAQKVPVCGVVSLAGAGRPAAVVVREQLAAQLPPERMAAVDAVFAELKAGRTVPGVPATDPLFRPAIQPYLISWLSLDPATELAKVKAPVLILQGDRDIQVSVDDARRLAADRPDARLVVLDGVSHVLKAAPVERAANAATYADPALPLDPRVVDEIVRFTTAAFPPGAAPR